MDPQRGNAMKTGSKAGAATHKVSAQSANRAQRKPSPVETTRTKPSASGPQKRPQAPARGARPEKAPLSARDAEERQAALPEGLESALFGWPPLPRAASLPGPGARSQKAPLSAEVTEHRQVALPEGLESALFGWPPLPRAASLPGLGARSQKAPLSAEVTEHRQVALPEGLESALFGWPPLPRAASLPGLGARSQKAPLSAEVTEDRQAALPEGLESARVGWLPLPRAASLPGPGARSQKAPLSAEDELDWQAILPEGSEPPPPRAGSRCEGGVHSPPGRRPLSRPTEVPDHDPLAPAPSPCLRGPARGAWKPRAVLKELTLRRSEISEAAEAVNGVVDHLLRRLRSCQSVFQDVSRLGTGSYYERVKVSAPNEFDVMFQLDIPRIELEEYNNSGAYYFVKCKRNLIGNPLNEFLDNRLLSASKMLSTFTEIITKEVENIADVTVKEKEEGCPAVTLLFSKPKEISVDIIMALKVKSTWPASTEEGLPIKSWLGAKVRKNLRLQPFYLVPKCAKAGNNFQGETWRLSFSHIEKNILENHGKAKTCCENEGVKCCRKDCLKLMKYLLEKLKGRVENHEELNEFCSYHVKTAFFHLCAENPDDSDWQSQDLELCFDRCVQYFLQCLEKECLEHFFIPGFNFFSQDKIDKISKEFLLNEIECERNSGYPIFCKS